MFQDRFELVRSDGEIKKTIAACPALGVDRFQTLGQGLVTGFVAEFALVIKNRLRERFPDFVTHTLTRELARSCFELLAKFGIGFGTAGKAHHRDGGRQLAIGREIVERRHKFAMGQVAGRAEDDDAARLGDGPSG